MVKILVWVQITTFTLKDLEEFLGPLILLYLFLCILTYSYVTLAISININQFRRSWNFSQTHLKSQMYFCFIWECLNLPEYFKNGIRNTVFYCELREFFFYLLKQKILYIGVLCFQLNICPHLTILNRFIILVSFFTWDRQVIIF